MTDDLLPRGAELLSEEKLNLIKPELSPGKRLLRAGCAPPGQFGLPGIATSIKIALWAGGIWIACALLLAAAFGAFGNGLRTAETFLVLSGLISGIVGLSTVIGALSSALSGWSERRGLKGRMYALTDRRAIFWVPVTGTAGTEIHSLSRGAVDSVSRVEYPDGSGDMRLDVLNPGFATSPFNAAAEVRRVAEIAQRALVVPRSDSDTSSRA